MTDDDAFIQAIIDSPLDEALRLNYADWLKGRDDYRAEYLRIEGAFRTLVPGSSEMLAAGKRWYELREVIDPGWLIQMDKRVSTPIGVGPDGQRAAEIIRAAMIAERQSNTCDCQAFYAPGQWKHGRKKLHFEEGLEPVLTIAFSGGLISDCFDGFDSERLEEPIQRHQSVVKLRRRVAELLHKSGFVAKGYGPTFAVICADHRKKSKSRPKSKTAKRKN